MNSKRRLNTCQTVGCGIPSSLLALRVDLHGLRSKLSWIRVTFSSDTRGWLELLPLHRQPICSNWWFQRQNALPCWRLNVETKTKRMLHNNRWLSYNKLMNAKNLVLHSSHFALNWHCCTAVLGECSSGGIWKCTTSYFKCYVDHLHTMYSSGNIEERNWVHLFESHCIICNQKEDKLDRGWNMQISITY